MCPLLLRSGQVISQKQKCPISKVFPQSLLCQIWGFKGHGEEKTARLVQLQSGFKTMEVKPEIQGSRGKE